MHVLERCPSSVNLIFVLYMSFLKYDMLPSSGIVLNDYGGRGSSETSCFFLFLHLKLTHLRQKPLDVCVNLFTEKQMIICPQSVKSSEPFL